MGKYLKYFRHLIEEKMKVVTICLIGLCIVAVLILCFILFGANDEFEQFYGEKKFQDKDYIKSNFKLKKYK